MRTLCLALTMAAAVAAALPPVLPAMPVPVATPTPVPAPPVTAPGAGPSVPSPNPMTGTWRGNWGTSDGVYDATHTLDMTLDASGTGQLLVAGANPRVVQCTPNVVPKNAPAGADSWTTAGTGGLVTCRIMGTGSVQQGMVGVLQRDGTAFSATYVHFNVPGLLTTMYLTKVIPSPAQHVLACENSAALLSCPTAGAAVNTRIRVTEAMFGRDDTSTCPYSGGAQAMQNTACRYPGALAALKSQCDGQRECAVPATNTRFGTDPCYLTYKYLRVTYVCA